MNVTLESTGATPSALRRLELPPMPRVRRRSSRAARDAHRPRAGRWSCGSPSPRRSATPPARPRNGPKPGVAAHPIRIEVIPEAGSLVKDLPNTIHVLTTTPDGRPAPTDRLRPESRVDAGELGVASFEFNPRRHRALDVQAEDEQGRTGRRQVLTCGAIDGDYLVRTDKAVYDGGEPVRVLVLGGGVEPVFLDLIKDGQTVLSESIEIAQGRGETGDRPAPELFGTVVLHAYRYGPGECLRSGSRGSSTSGRPAPVDRR